MTWEDVGLAYEPAYLNLYLFGTVNNFSALAGAETFTLWSGTGGTGSMLSVKTGTIGPAGDPDFTTSPPNNYPTALRTVAQNAVFVGYDTHGVNFSASPLGYSGAPTLALNESIVVSGYLDLFVDPGSLQVGIEPPISIAKVNGHPVVSWPAGLAGFVLESTTNLVTGPWVTNSATVTTLNGTNSITINPATGTMFYRLKE